MPEWLAPDQSDATGRRVTSERGRVGRVDATGRNLNDRDTFAADRLVRVVGGSVPGAGDSPEPDVALRLHALDACQDVVVLDDSRRRVVKVEHVQAVGAQAPQATGDRGLECGGAEISRRPAVECPDQPLGRQRRPEPVARLRAEHDVLPPSGQRVAQHPLAVT